MVRLRPRNLFVRPDARVVSTEPGKGGQTVRLRIDGMVCDI